MDRLAINQQSGMTLIEVMVAVLVLSVGVLGAAAVQLNSLKHTDSALMASQASFIAYDMLDRLRASPNGTRQQDLADFNHNVTRFGGETANGTVSSNQGWVTITIVWDDARAADSSIPLRRFVLSSRVAAFP